MFGPAGARKQRRSVWRSPNGLAVDESRAGFRGYVFGETTSTFGTRENRTYRHRVYSGWQSCMSLLRTNDLRTYIISHVFDRENVYPLFRRPPRGNLEPKRPGVERLRSPPSITDASARFSTVKSSARENGRWKKRKTCLLPTCGTGIARRILADELFIVGIAVAAATSTFSILNPSNVKNRKM